MKTSLLICLCLSVLALVFAIPQPKDGKEVRKDAGEIGDASSDVKPKPQENPVSADKTSVSGADGDDKKSVEDDTAEDDDDDTEEEEDDNNTEEDDDEASDSDQQDDSADDDEDEDHSSDESV